MSGKAKIIMSDLHLGAGRVQEGNRLEDFVSDDAFSELLQARVVESQRDALEIELIFAGDAFDLLQVPALEDPATFDPQAAYPKERYIPTDEAASAAKMALVIDGHPRFFAALRSFLQATAPRRTVTFIKGNHDINLHWLGVQRALRTALGATGARSTCLTFEERRITREGIYVEHGNQYTERINRFPDFEEPHDPDVPGQLYLPPGSSFVFSFFNGLERRYYWMDGVKPLTALVWYIFALDPPLALRALLALLRELPALIWGSLPVEWAMSTYLEAHEQLLEELQDPKRIQALQSNLSELGEFYRRVELALVLYGTPNRAAGQPTAADVREYAVLPRALAEEQAQRSALRRVARQKRDQERAKVIVFGHTHEAAAEALGEGAVYLNCGTWTWLRTFDSSDFAAWKRLFRDPGYYTQERHLTYARVDYDAEGQPEGKLLLLEPRRPARPGFWARAFERVFSRR